MTAVELAKFSQRRLRAIVVDDDALSRRLAIAVLRDAGISEVLQAADGSEALTQIHDAAPAIDLALCDLNMAGMDGVEFLTQLGIERPGMCVILLSAMESSLISAVESMAISSGLRVLGALQKPLARDRLHGLLGGLAPVPGRQPGPAADAAITPADIRAGLKAHQFMPFFQPKIDLATGKLIGAESLVRWKHPQHGLIVPARFIPLAESHGLIVDLTWAMLSSSMTYLKEWLADGLELDVSVNITASFLQEIAITENIVALAAIYGVPARNMILELTESMATTDVVTVIGNLARLRMRGFGLSIDDFGTGYASMQQLSRIPFSELKVDQSFVSGAQRQPHLRTILESSVRLGKRLGLTTTAEGVETADEWNLVKSFGCDIAQGFFIAQPMEADAFPAWVEEWKRRGSRALTKAIATAA